ncbi:Stf0 family sulfotransferase [Streptosporangium sandarakinum]|uniref:Trehalose 2-sulfotransferase n=1 Tax=Streptosporangium sandarakinum TaxID=1260955 RepID=A0A852V8J2_9ACTN|nr:Stf0 family sulfotransferase [Streptosporangium sandarakinum]NYF43424.1 LPS sulfotransferase NodH [Streptosporangium sandarakinum]
MDHVARFDSYFVCATPRTGSSLLLGLLGSTGVAGRPQAYFREPDEPLWAERWGVRRTAGGGYDHAGYVRAALAAGRSGNGVFGAKLMWGALGPLLAKLRTVHPGVTGGDLALLERAFGRTAFVCLRRDDTLAQAVSWLRAEQTRTWFIGGDGEISGNDDGDGHEPRYDAEEITRFVRTIEDHNAAWEAWFSSAGVRPYRVRYEDLAEDVTGATRRVLGFLGVEAPPDRAIAARHRRQADELNRDWMARYRAEQAPHGGRAGSVPTAEARPPEGRT